LEEIGGSLIQSNTIQCHMSHLKTANTSYIYFTKTTIFLAENKDP